jgi:hypothetical protein
MDKIDKALEKFRSSKKYKRKDAHWGQVHRTRDNNPAKNPEAQKKRIKNYDWDKVSTCEHCGKTIKSESNFKRWHGDNCKKAPNAKPRGYKAHKHYTIYRELTTGFTGTNMELLNRFPKLNTPSIMNSVNNNKPLERGSNKGLHFEKVV